MSHAKAAPIWNEKGVKIEVYTGIRYKTQWLSSVYIYSIYSVTNTERPLGTGLGLGLHGDLYPGKYVNTGDCWGESNGGQKVKKSKKEGPNRFNYFNRARMSWDMVTATAFEIQFPGDACPVAFVPGADRVGAITGGAPWGTGEWRTQADHDLFEDMYPRMRPGLVLVQVNGEDVIYLDFDCECRRASVAKIPVVPFRLLPQYRSHH